MKKAIALLSLVALAVTATAFANDNHLGLRAESGLHLGWFKQLEKRFVLTGTVSAVGTNSLVVNVTRSAHVDLTDNSATVNVNSDTKITSNQDQAMTLADVKAGNKVVVQGTVSDSDSTLTASRIYLLIPTRAFGEVTAKTDDSITIKNNLNGVIQTFTTNDDTKVSINGEAKTAADVQVGDRGWVKFKAEASILIAKFIALFR